MQQKKDKQRTQNIYLITCYTGRTSICKTFTEHRSDISGHASGQLHD